MTAEPHPQLDLRRVFGAVRRWAWLIAALVAGAFVLIYATSSVRTAMYTSIAEVRINPPEDLPASDTKFTGNEIYNIRSVGVRQAVNVQLGSDALLIEDVDVTALPDTDVISIAVTSSSPEVAKAAADAFATNFEEIRRAQLVGSYTDQAAELRNQGEAVGEQVKVVEAEMLANPGANDIEVLRQEVSGLRERQSELNLEAADADLASRLQADRVRVEKTANTPAFADSPTPLRDAGIAAVVALVFALGLVFLLEQMDNRIKSPDQIVKATNGVPMLGSITVYSASRRATRKFHASQRTLVPPTSPSAESYRTLATSLRFSSLGKEKSTILVTSSSGGEGKTTVTANLAAVLAESGLRVVVVSADLRRPMLGELLGIAESSKGLTSAMLGDRDLSSCFESVALPSGRSMFVLPTGPLPHEPAVLLGSDMFGTVLEQIKKAGADFILVDCAPVLPVSDPLAASRHVDGVIVVTLHGKTKEANLAETVDRLRQVDADIIGVVLNGVPTAGQYAYSNFYGYSTYEQTTTKPTAPPSSTPTPSENGAATNGAAGGVGAPGSTGASGREVSLGTSQPTGSARDPGPPDAGLSVRARVGENLANRPAPKIVGIGVFLIYVAVCLLEPDLVNNVTFVDPIILAVCGYSVISMTHQGSPATSGARKAFPWLWLILLGSFLGLAGVGMAGWASENLLRTTFALMAFFCLWHVLIVGRLQKLAVAGTIIGFAVTCLTLAIGSGGQRGRAFFPHANYAGHYGAMAAVVLLSVARRWVYKAMVLVGLFLVVNYTSSFGAMAMTVSMLAVYIVRALTRYTAVLAVGLAAVIGGLFLATPQAADLVPEDGSSWSFSETISEKRFDRSQSGRLELWGQAIDAYKDSPLGLGPDGVRQRKIAALGTTYLEIHSDPLGYLVERGVIGLIGFVGFWASLFLFARKRGIARVLIVGIVVSGLFRETMHYRHMWALLAVAFALDHLRNRQDAEDDDEGEADTSTGGASEPERLEDSYFPGVARWPAGPPRGRSG